MDPPKREFVANLRIIRIFQRQIIWKLFWAEVLSVCRRWNIVCLSPIACKSYASGRKPHSQYAKWQLSMCLWREPILLPHKTASDFKVALICVSCNTVVSVWISTETWAQDSEGTFLHHSRACTALLHMSTSPLHKCISGAQTTSKSPKQSTAATLRICIRWSVFLYTEFASSPCSSWSLVQRSHMTHTWFFETGNSMMVQANDLQHLSNVCNWR